MPDRSAGPGPEHAADAGGSAVDVLRASLRLGLTSFGGPIAHLGYFRTEYVDRRRWIDDGTYAELIGVCQSLPGPTSSQVGMLIGARRAGMRGALAAWIGFTLPSALIMLAAALLVGSWTGLAASGLLHGLKLAAVAVVGVAVVAMARTLAPDLARRMLALGALGLMLLLPGALAQVAVLVGAGGLGVLLLRGAALPDPAASFPSTGSHRRGALLLAVVALLLVALPAARLLLPGWHALALFDSFFRAGALVFGGGHVVLPLLAREVVAPGWVTPDQFLAGYGVAQAVPGPLFTFASYLGAIEQPDPNGVLGATLATIAIFLPGTLIAFGVLPFWRSLRDRGPARAGLAGVNAAVVGILAAALYDPLWTSAIRGPADALVAVALFVALVGARVPALVIVAAGAGAGVLLEVLAL